MNIHIRELARPDRAALESHFLALDNADRRLRFGASLNDAALRAYLARIDFGRDATFGVIDDEMHLCRATSARCSSSASRCSTTRSNKEKRG